MPRLLYLFSVINLIIGSSAFVLASIVEPLARDLGVSVAAAGQATTAYAVGTALLAPHCCWPPGAGRASACCCWRWYC